MNSKREQSGINIRCAIQYSLLYPILCFCDSWTLQEAINAYDKNNYPVALEKFGLLANQGDISAYTLCDYYWAKEKNKRQALSCLEIAVQWQLTDYEYKSLNDSTNDGYFLKGLNNSPEFKNILFKKINEYRQPGK